MKTCKLLLSVVLAVLVLAGSCLAADVSGEQAPLAAQPPTAVALSDATGTMLTNAREDLEEIRSNLSPTTRNVQLFNADDVTIYDYGTRAVGDYDVSTTLYTFDTNSTRASGQAGGITVHTYTQSGFVRFKLYFKMIFSYDGTNVSPVWNENLTWSNSEDAILDCGEPYDSYIGNSCQIMWSYSVQYGTLTEHDDAYISCTNQGVVTHLDESLVFPAS